MAMETNIKEKIKEKPKQVRNGRDTHLYLDDEMWEELAAMSARGDRSVTGTIRMLIKIALRLQEAHPQIFRKLG